MKTFAHTVLLALTLISATMSAETLEHGDTRSAESTIQPYTGVYSYNALSSVQIKTNSFSLTADSGSLLHGLEIQVSALPYRSGMMLQSNMENVSLLSDGVRLLPNGEHFSEDAPALITLAYDPARIPMGYAPTDIYTYYSDDNTNWYRLERVAVDTIAHTILSYTTHFTDFANAVIKVPEMPDSKAYVPTDMQDLPDPDPLVGIPMIGTPHPNHMGTAELSYPIQTPPGRHGLQPNLDLHYSSAGGNGLLGVGWSIAQPAVTIDTRWGVPRYLLSYETEAYLINGEPYLMHDNADMPIPLPHMASSFVPRRTRATRFYARDQRNQSKAVRHGQTPDHYWWSVTTTDGVTYYYGYDPYSHTIDENSILRTKEGYIGHWALTYVIDRFDNYIQYKNHKYSENEIVIDTIEYTGNHTQNLQPYYKVVFKHKGRYDGQLDARLGLLRKQNHLLCQLSVLVGAELTPITTYRLYYELGAYSLYKSRLKSIAKIDGGIQSQECGVPIQHTELILSDEKWIDVEDTMYSAFTHEGMTIEKQPGSLTQFNYEDAINSDALFENPKTLISSPVNYSASRTEGWNLGGTATIGVGLNPAETTFSAGANYSYTRNKGGVEAMMIDLNGDGLLDRLQVSNGTVTYQRQNNSGYFASPITIQGLDRLSREVSSSHTFGLQLDFGANLSYNPVISNSYTDIYFADINSDGLPDLVTPEGVRINLLNSNGVPTFSPITDSVEGIEVHGNNCSKSITFNGMVDDSLMCTLIYECIDTLLLGDLQPSDDGEAEFVEHPMTSDEPEPEGPGNLEPDHWNPLPIDEGKAELKMEQPSLEEYVKYPLFASNTEKSSVKSEPEVSWADILSSYYQGDNYSFRLINDTIFVYQKNYDCAHRTDEPNIDVVRVWVSDRTGLLRINSTASLIPDSSFSRVQARNADGVRLRIQWNRNIRQAGDSLVADTVQMLYDHIVEADDYDSVLTSHILYVQSGDVLFFRLSALKNRRFDNLNWEQSILSISGDTLYNSARNYLCSGEQSFIAPAQGTARIHLSCVNDATEPVLMTAKLENTQILNRTLSPHSTLDTLFYRTVSDSSRISFYVDSLSAEPQWSKVRIVPTVDYWGSLVVDTAGHLLSDTLHYFSDVHIGHSSFYTNDTCLYRRLFGPLYRGWGWFAYNNVQNDSIIYMQSLRNEEYMMADSAYANMDAYHNDNAYEALSNPTLSVLARMQKADSCFSAVPMYNPLSEDKRWVAMHSDYKHNRYLVYGNTGALGQNLHSVSRQLESIRDSSIVREEIEEYDSPIPTLHGGMQRITTIRKSTHSVQHGITYGLATPIGVGISENVSFGSYDVTSDYMDMNGDGYPDFVGVSAIQYTMPWGGIGLLEGELPRSFSNTNSSAGLGFSASRPRPEHIPANGVKESKMAYGGFGGGLSGQVGTDETHTSLMDINADGLPDIIDADHSEVKYNLGYSFTDDWYPISYLKVAASEHTDVSISLSQDAHFEQIRDVVSEMGNIKDYSLAQYSISGGFSSSTSQNKSDYRLIDINGDGYLDLLTDFGSGNIRVQYFDGTNFGTQQILNAQNLQTSNTANLGFNLGVTGGFDLVAIPVKFCFGIQSSPWNVSSSYGKTDFMDVNGDGYVDQVISGNTLQVRYNKNGNRPVNLLTRVMNPTGQTISIGYNLSAPSVNHRTRTWQMVHLEDTITPMLDHSSVHVYQYNYSDPFYDNFERTDYGYAQVSTQDEGRYYLNEGYMNRYYVTHGEKADDLLLNEDNEPMIGHRRDLLYQDIQDIPQTDVCDDIYLHLWQDGYRTDYYETESSAQITTRYEKIYDAHHNLIQYNDYGDVAFNGDEWFQYISYKPTTSYNMISLPNVERVKDGVGNVLRLSRVKYDSVGQPYQIIMDDTVRHISAITALQYDMYGNIRWLRAPKNENNEWSWRRFEYDDSTKTHVTRVFNQFFENHYYNYDLRFGLRNYSLDPAGNEMIWRYDRMGRLIDIVAPNEVDDSLPFSIHYIYRQPYHDFFPGAPQILLYPHVTKVAADSSLASVDVTIYDARGQALQRKSWKYLQGDYQWVTDGWRIRDPWYRPTKTYDPFRTDITSHPLWLPDNVNTNPYATFYEYDALDRVTRCQHPDATENRTRYHFANDSYGRTRLLTLYKDENAIEHQILQAPQGWTLETQNLTDNSKTRYEYNPIGELSDVIDADSYHTRYWYDMFGNRIIRRHPDAGVTRWNYAPDGSLISVKTARMSGTGDSIHYVYCFGKLTDILYPRTPFNNVHYRYDKAGRMAYYEDGTGSTRLYYDRMGNVRLTHRRVVMPTESNVYTFRTRSIYDSFGRIREIIYPDADTVTYKYYLSGELQEVLRSPLLGICMPVVSKLKYDVMGHNRYRQYGNGVSTDYFYEPYRNRLDRMRTVAPSCPLQDVMYTYDGVSNITTIMQSEPSCNTLGGQYKNIYTYDAQNRLINAISPSGSSFLYNFYANYSPAGRLGHGFCGNTSGVADESSLYGYDEHRLTHQPRVIFDRYNNRHTQLLWDANGNLSTLWMCDEKVTRFHDWDDENRLRMVLDNRRTGYYGYDANGDRVYKLTGTSTITHTSDEVSDAVVYLDSAVLYPNPFVTITSQGYTKHYYANGERLATSIGQGGWCYTSPDVISGTQTDHEEYLLMQWGGIYSNEYPFEYHHESFPDLTKNVDITGINLSEIQYKCPIRHLKNLTVRYDHDLLYPVMSHTCEAQGAESEIFYTHGDHLGSACWITNCDGKPIQYMHYLPYGQLLANQTPYGYDERYKFTGKERDAETGYDYFGARYYMPLLYHWTKVDPLVDDYLHISPYAYCNWNPIKHVDPDGQWAQIVIGAAVSAAADAAIQVGASMYKGNSFGQAVRNIDMRSVAGSAVAGAIGVGVVSKVKQATRIYKLGKASTAIAKEMGSVTGDAIGSVVSQEIATGNISSAQVKNDVIGGLVGNTAGKIKANSLKTTAGYKRALNQLDHAERVANGSTRSSRLQAVENAQNAVDNYGSSASQAVSSGVSKITSDALKAQDNSINDNY